MFFGSGNICASVPFSVAVCGRTGGVCVQRCNHGHSAPFCCDAQKRPHFEIISPLLQGKLTKWNFISCLINTQPASAFCQRAPCWICSSLCSVSSELQAPARVQRGTSALTEMSLEGERRRWCVAEGLTLINWDSWHRPHWFTCWRSPPHSCNQPSGISWVTGTWRSPRTSDSDTEHSFQHGIILFTTLSVPGLNTSGTPTWELWVTPPLGWNYRALRSDSREVWTSPAAHPLLPRHSQIWVMTSYSRRSQCIHILPSEIISCLPWHNRWAMAFLPAHQHSLQAPSNTPQNISSGFLCSPQL